MNIRRNGSTPTVTITALSPTPRTLIEDAAAAEADALNASAEAARAAADASGGLFDITGQLNAARETLSKAMTMEAARAAQDAITTLDREHALANSVRLNRQEAARQAEAEWRQARARTEELKAEAVTIRERMPAYHRDVERWDHELVTAQDAVRMRERQLEGAQAAVEARLTRLEALTGART